ncbi:uncharacterized protein LOC107021923 [Solanum pennellii]|uniref:Uncharacterized protein LOC107021923 n=1 Tax=Solanum pennellii TaxID=28526 RepID=A0ABM1VBW2_SOLPN|nr:uncharacterized protein LOC107021923 [Solanum pennellii]
MAALKHNAYLNNHWTPDEQSALEELLVKYSSDNEMHRYAKIAMHLKDKCLRDVILRCRWMSKNRKQGSDHISNKEKLTDLMPKLTNYANAPPNAQAILPMDSNGEIFYQAIGGPTGMLLEQNAQALDQISANFAACEIQENINLLWQTQSNIFNVINNLNDISEMNLMPPLPIRLNEELANSILQQPPPVQENS